MRELLWWPVIGVVVLVAALAGCGGVAGGPASAAVGQGQMVQLPDGRAINLRCTGRGTPTVLLESGFGADSGAWSKAQPALSRGTRVCAYDRAGYGYSDPGPLPRDGATIARDLDQALEAAGVEGPYIVVGHSAGGLYARLFAARRPGEVAGLVLLDPTVERRAPQAQGDGLDGIRRRLQRCIAAAEAAPQPSLADPAWSGCLSARSSEHAVEIARRPATWRGQLSELDAIFGRTSEQVVRIGSLLSDVPIYVITASETAAAAPIIPFGPPISIWEANHQQIAAQSQHGFQTTVVSPHLVMIARPEVVVAAVKAMVSANRAGRPPDPLPPSETDPPPPADKLEDPGAIQSPFGRPFGDATSDPPK